MRQLKTNSFSFVSNVWTNSIHKRTQKKLPFKSIPSRYPNPVGRRSFSSCSWTHRGSARRRGGVQKAHTRACLLRETASVLLQSSVMCGRGGSAVRRDGGHLPWTRCTGFISVRGRPGTPARLLTKRHSVANFTHVFFFFTRARTLCCNCQPAVSGDAISTWILSNRKAVSELNAPEVPCSPWSCASRPTERPELRVRLKHADPVGSAESAPRLHRVADVERSVVLGQPRRWLRQAQPAAAHRLHPGGRPGLPGCRLPRLRDQDAHSGPAGGAGSQAGKLLRAAAVQPVQEPADDRQVRCAHPYRYRFISSGRAERHQGAKLPLLSDQRGT